jgi:hypothetical protein
MNNKLQLALVPLCSAKAQLAERLFLPATPAGSRSIVEVVSARFRGERLAASLKGQAAADWLIVSPDGRLGLMDVRCTIETDDGALIYLQYNGRIQISSNGGPNWIYVAPRFETGDERYSWLNHIQAVGKGVVEPATRRLTYDFYELV